MRANSGNTQRKNGIDLLRILSMYMVVVLHVAVMMRFAGVHTHEYLPSQVWESLSIVAVNVFSIITGYLLVQKKWHLSSITSLYIQVLFYYVSIALAWQYCFKDGPTLGVRYLLSALNPVHTYYWYFNSYVFVFFAAPYINKLCQTLTGKEMLSLLITAGAILSLLGWNETGHLAWNGHNAFWISYMYIWGAYIRVHGCNIPSFKSKILSFVIYIIASFSLFIVLHTGYHEDKLFREYDSPLILISSIALFLSLYSISVPNVIGKIMQFISPSAFAVYLIHCHPYVWHFLERVFRDCSAQYNFFSTNSLVVIDISVIIFLVSVAIDLIRRYIFHILKINEVTRRFFDRITIFSI